MKLLAAVPAVTVPIAITLILTAAAGCAADELAPEAAGAADGTAEAVSALGAGWCNEQPVAIVSLPAGMAVAEPFIRVAGTTVLLYFNDYVNELRDLHHAVWIPNVGFVYRGPLQGVNTAAQLEAAPSIDAQGYIYFTNTAVPEMVSRGWLVQPETVAFAAPVAGMPVKVQSGSILQGNMDFGVAPNHPFGILSRAVWATPNPVPVQADLWYLRRAGGAVAHEPLETAYFLGALNTQDRLEYAAEVSGDGLAIVYTQLDPSTGTTRIMASVRARVDLPFGPPAAIVDNAPGTAIEGPTFATDRIFFHKVFIGGGPTRLYTVERCGA